MLERLVKLATVLTVVSYVHTMPFELVLDPDALIYVPVREVPLALSMKFAFFPLALDYLILVREGALSVELASHQVEATLVVIA